MAATQPTDNNGRITLAVLGTKLDTVIDEVRGLRQEMTGVQAWCTESKTRWSQHDKEHADLEREISNKRNLGDVVTGALAVILGALGIIYKP
jgi:hypothetical protein